MVFSKLRKELLATLGGLALAGCSSEEDIIEKVPIQYRASVQKAISSAGNNSSELIKALETFKNDSEKLEATSFLVSETPRRMHRKHPVDWTWDLAHKDYTEISDVAVIKSNDLVDNVNWAFVARDRFPWAKELYDGNKPLFFSGVLPYRLGTSSIQQLPEDVGHWRAIFLDEKVFSAVKEKYGLKTEFKEIEAKLEDLVNSYKQATTPDKKDAVLKDFTRFVEFDFMPTNGLKYFPRGPEEKTLDVFLTSEVKDGVVRRGGRCTDGDNNSRYLHMSAGIPTSSIRFIAWPAGDDNHEVMRVLLPGKPFDMSTCIHADNNSEQLEYVVGKVGKVYEETWGTRDASSEVVWNLKDGEELPWYINFYLRTRSTTDVTDRYGPTRNVKIQTQRPGQLIYLGVMNNNSDTPLGTATVAIDRADERGIAEFDKVGSDSIFYIPYTYDELNGEPMARAVSFPFVLRKDGTERIFGSGFDATKYSPSTLTGLEPERIYELSGFFVQSGWSLRSTITSRNNGTADVSLADSAVYVLRSKSNNGLMYSRPFALTDGKIEKF
ncbi:MAG: hypothetical protein AABX10_04510 [Nanoarchaeota archaeon]